MIIIPAIDIKDAKVVRLVQGQFDRVTEYSADPVAMARQWISQRAPWLHVVDLDGAESGTMKNLAVITQIAKSVPVPIQVGGGIRTSTDIATLIQSGVRRVILGTKAIENRDFLKEAIRNWPDRIAVALDCSQGRLATKGWAAISDIQAVDFARELETLGVSCLVYTDITRDGTLTGPNFDGIQTLLDKVKTPVIVSGGIAKIEDLRKLLAMSCASLWGVIVGKSIYEGTLDLPEAIALCSQSE